MRWQYKAAVQKALSLVPQGERLNYVLQRHVSKKLPASDRQFFLHFEQARYHVDQYAEYGPRPLKDATAYEFGAGWDLIGPLSLWTLGVSRQVVVDIRDHLRLSLINHSLSQLARHHSELEQRYERALRLVDPSPVRSIGHLKERFGIDYRAPCDARRTGLPSGCFDLISSTFTLEHIPAEDILAIFAESARLLADGGIVSSSIDMNDHCAFDDPRISTFNYLRYPSWQWRVINSSIHYQNRLRTRDYRELFAAAQLSIIHEQVELADAADLAELRRLPLAARYARGYTMSELEPVSMFVVATRASSSQ
jgi:SAM-dependent methyltransferase